MAKELYKRVSPHLQRVLVDGGTTTSNMNDLLLLQRSNEQYKDYLMNNLNQIVYKLLL